MSEIGLNMYPVEKIVISLIIHEETQKKSNAWLILFNLFILNFWGVRLYSH